MAPKKLINKPNFITSLVVILLLSFNALSQTTSIPDSSFEQALIDYNIDTNGLNGNILNSDAESIVNLNIFSKNITDLTGIEAFTNLKYLYCYFNNVTSLDLQNNPELEVLDIENNSLTSLNIAQNNNLKELYVSNNLLTSLDVSNNFELEVLSCNLNDLSTLDVQNNLDLSVLWCYSNDLESINIAHNILLESLFCGDNNLINLDVSTNTLLETISCSQNSLMNLNVDNCTDLSYLDVSGNNLNNIDINSNHSLKRLLCNNNSIQELDVSMAPELLLLYASYNLLEDIQLSNNDAMRFLRLENNQLESIDFRNGNNANISNFNATNNTRLTCIYVNDTSASFLEEWDIDAASNFVTSESECNALSVIEVGNEVVLFQVYPNPVTDYLNIQTVSNYSNLNVFDVNGKTVLNQGLQFGLNTIDFSSLSSGMYLVKIASEDQPSITKKIIVE